MSGNKYIDDVSDVVLAALGVGPFILESTLKKYIARKGREEIEKIITRNDLPYGLDELVDLSIQDLIEKKIIIKYGKSIQRPSATKNINHRS